jgi:hypothetical protein
LIGYWSAQWVVLVMIQLFAFMTMNAADTQLKWHAPVQEGEYLQWWWQGLGAFQKNNCDILLQDNFSKLSCMGHSKIPHLAF